jgi:hypothetical protein
VEVPTAESLGLDSNTATHRMENDMSEDGELIRPLSKPTTPAARPKKAGKKSKKRRRKGDDAVAI